MVTSGFRARFRRPSPESEGCVSQSGTASLLPSRHVPSQEDCVLGATVCTRRDVQGGPIFHTRQMPCGARPHIFRAPNLSSRTAETNLPVPRDGSVSQDERGIPALVRSQAGTGGGVALSTCPTCRLTRFDAQVFRVLLMRRLQMPLPLTARNCRCGHFLDVFGHHRAACARAGVLSKRGVALESATARIFREAGGRVTTNVLVRDPDLEGPGPGQVDARRLKLQLTGCHCSVERSSQSMRPSSALCAVMGLPEEAPQRLTASL